MYVCVQGGLSALMMCCEEGNSEMAKLLLQSQATPNLQQSVESYSPTNNYYTLLPLTCQSTGYTALMFASKGGHLDTVKVLREHGADPLIRNAVSLHHKSYFQPGVFRQC